MTDFDIRVRRSQALKASNSGDFNKAYQLGASLLKERPNDKILYELVGIAAARLGRFGIARKHLMKAVKFQPKKPVLHQVLGEVANEMGHLDEAIERFDKVLSLSPKAAPAIAGKAGVLERRGDNDAGRALLMPYIEAGVADPVMVAAFATIEQSEGRHQETIELLSRQMARPGIDMMIRSRLCQLLAKACEKTKDYDKAFEAYTLSNKAVAQPFDPKAYIAQIDDLIATFSKSNLAMLPKAADRSELPVFIASMPRSGSTLVEQIIHAHSQAYGAGEITELEEMVMTLPDRLESLQQYPDCLGDFTQARADEQSTWYLKQLRTFAPDVVRITNKHLDNWMYLGMVQLLFPGARVVHAKRNPLDNCFSVFMAAMNARKYPWATDLAHTGLVYKQCERLMEHWHDVLDIEILDVQYEDVIEDPDAWIRKIIDFCGLPWEERCLRYYEADRDVMTLSYDQVRRPIYKSAVARWQRYEAHLDPLKAALGMVAESGA